jgi:hypothetical protein
MPDESAIRTMTRDEIDLALEWAAAEGWNPGWHDAAAFHAADPEGFLIGHERGEPVALISAVRYGGSFGFIGFYIVRPDRRARVPEKAAVVRLSKDGSTATFDPADGFVDFPGGAKKFTIRQDPRGGGYWSLASIVPDRHAGAGRPAGIRNTLALVHGKDLRTWEIRGILLYHRTSRGTAPSMSTGISTATTWSPSAAPRGKIRKAVPATTTTRTS